MKIIDEIMGGLSYKFIFRSRAGLIIILLILFLIFRNPIYFYLLVGSLAYIVYWIISKRKHLKEMFN